MNLAPGFVMLLQALSPNMTAPTFESFVTVVTGWVFSGSGTITRSILAAGDLATKHFSSYHRKAAAKSRRTYRSRPELAVELLHLLCNHRKSRRFHVVADSAYGGQSVLCNLPENCGLTSRLLPTTRLYAPAPAPKKGRKGRPPIRGARLPSPAAMLEGRCRRATLDIYGTCQKARVADCVARAYAAPTRPLRVVATEAIGGGRGVEVFYSTCPDATAEQVIGQYASRWSIEVAYRDVKQSLGFEQPQGWCRRTVERTAPLAMLIYSLVIIWFAREGHRHWQPADHAWYATKRDPSFADMLAELKRRSISSRILSLPLDTLGPRKLFRILENAVNLAV